MSQVSKRNLNIELSDKIKGLFNDSLNINNSKYRRSKLLDELLTSTERKMLVKRIAIGVLYSAGYKYRDISNVLKISTSTARSYISLYKEQGEYFKVVNKLRKDEKTKASIEKMIYVAAKIFDVGGSKGGFWRAVTGDLKDRQKIHF